jgi:hypothetical protein
MDETNWHRILGRLCSRGDNSFRAWAPKVVQNNIHALVELLLQSILELGAYGPERNRHVRS